MCMRRVLGETFQELGLFLHHKGPNDQAEVIRLGSKYLYPLSNLSSPVVLNLSVMTPLEIDNPSHEIFTL